jgi:SEC-C motif
MTLFNSPLKESYMQMIQLNDLLPEDQWETYWTILGDQHEELPDDKEYVIFEYYCSKPTCYCKRLVAGIHEIGPDGEPFGKPSAVIEYDWSSDKTSCRPILLDDSPRTKTALNILKVYTKHIHEEEYLARIKSHYTRVKALASRTILIQRYNPRKDVGRNDPCPCGSNKKYKKCCLNN